MSSLSAYQNNQENEILSAGPLELVEILYKAAIQSIEDARRHLKSGDIRERSNAISKAGAILNELAQSLDHEKGGAISKNLTELYDYMQRQLLQANMEQIEPPLIETCKLLETLLEGWQTCSSTTPSSAYKSRYDEEHVPIACSF
jgi:flagellar protein FliS